MVLNLATKVRDYPIVEEITLVSSFEVVAVGHNPNRFLLEVEEQAKRYRRNDA